MAVLGKRKAAAAPAQESAEEIFRRHFEARFAPLDGEEATATADDNEVLSDGDDDDESEWGGLSDEEDGDSSEGDGNDGMFELV